MSAQEDMLTPRGNIEGFLATAKEDNTTPDVSKRAATSLSASTVFKIPDQPESFIAPRLLVSSNTAPTPGSKFTPRTNVFNLIHFTEDSEQTPTVRGSDWLDQASSESGVSATKHPEWVQEVNLSPMSLSHTSEGQEDSPSTVKQVFKRPRRSFHIPVPKRVVMAQAASKEISEGNPTVVGVEGGDLPVVVLENLDFFVGTNLEGIQTSALDNFGAEASTHSSLVQASTLENFDAETGTHLSLAQASTLDNFGVEVGTHLEGGHLSGQGAKAEGQDVEAEGQDVEAEGQIDEAEGQDVEAEGQDVEAEGQDVEAEGQDVEAEGQDVEADGQDVEAEGQDVEAEGQDVEAEGQDVEAEGQDVEAEGQIAEAEGQDVEAEGQDVEGELLNADSLVVADVNTEYGDTSGGRLGITGENDKLGFEVAEENNSVEHEESTKEKSFVGSRTSLTSKHGKISFILSPKRTPKDTQAALTPTSSVYDLSESSSNSSGDVHITKQKSSSPRNRINSVKSSGKRGLGRAKSSKQNISSGPASVSRSKSKLSYSEWKSQQQGKDTSGQTTNFLDSHYPLSSTPFDRRKKIFHSTRIHHSVHADEDAAMLEAQTTDSIPNISPIRPVGKRQAERGTGIGQEMMDENTVRDNQDGVQQVCLSIEHRESGSFNQHEQNADVGEDSSDAVFPGFSPLATPHINMNKRTQEPAVGQKSAQELPARPHQSGSGQKRLKEKEPTNKQPRKRAKTSSDTALPRRSVKFFAERHSTMKLSKDAVEEIEKASEIFWDSTFKALETFALHAGRKTVKEEDVVLLMKTQRLIRDTEDLHDGIREFLPMELRSELIPMAKP